MPTIISGDGTITGLTATGISAVQNLPATGSFSTLGVTGDLSFNSGYGSSAVAYGCRAWVNFNGTGTVAIRASGNVSSITDNNTGDYTVNFTNALADANYAVVVGAGEGLNSARVVNSSARAVPTTSAARIGIQNSGGSDADAAYTYAAVFRQEKK